MTTSVLFVDTARSWRGGQVQIERLARSLPGAAVAAPPDSALVERLRGVLPVVPIPFRGGWRGGRALRSVASDFAVVAPQDGPSIHHALGCDRPVVAHRRIDDAPRWFGRRAWPRVDAWIAVSEAVAGVLVRHGVARQRIDVIRSGVPPRPSAPEPPGPPWQLLCLGAWVPHKGHRDLILALEGRSDVALTLAGEGPEGEPLARLAAQTGVTLSLAGPLDADRALARAHLLVHPSRTEGLGQAVIEARLAGVPVVSTTAGGLPEAAGPGACVTPGDVAGLRRAIDAALVALPERRRQARAERAAVASQFDPDAAVAAVAAVYDRVALAASGAVDPRVRSL